MPENSWPENESHKVFAPLDPIFDLTDVNLSDTSSFLDQGLVGRRRKAAVALSLVWGGVIALHLLSWGVWLISALTLVMLVHALRVVFVRPPQPPEPLSAELSSPDDWPYVSLLVAAKNEESVIGGLVRRLCSLDYPAHRYDLWVINDDSSDRTSQILDRLAQQYPQLNVIHRDATATGGKSGALNLVWPQTQADIIAVFDADAQVPPDLLRRVLSYFDQPSVGAVQVRKAIANAGTNFWTKGQVAEMALDTFFQQQRIALGGIGELRGNGQFVRRQALETFGGWNEETITDDLDLTLRLHLSHWDIGFLCYPAVQEEGVTRAMGLWHQRNRWAEGGYQRYLDYWRWIAQNRMGFSKTFDLVMFLITQYVLPMAAIPDLAMALWRGRPPVLAPVTTLTTSLLVFAMFAGLRRTSKPSVLIAMLQTLRGTLYMLHWIPVMTSTTMRMAVRPKRLKWVKTVHQGSDDEWLDVEVSNS